MPESASQIKLGYDTIVSVAMPFLGAAAGFVFQPAEYINPILPTSGVTMGVLGLPEARLFSYGRRIRHAAGNRTRRFRKPKEI